MRVVHVLKHTVYGNGHVHVAVDLACEQARAGHEVTVVHGGGSFGDVLRRLGVDVVVLPDLDGGRGRVVHALLALWRAVRERRPAVLHAHMMSSAVLGRLVAPLVGARLVTTVHNSFDGHSGLMRLGSAVVAVSEAERALLVSRGFPADRLSVVLNGPVASPRESDPPARLELRTPCIATVCGLHARKGLDDVVAAFAQVAGEFPRWHLNLVGAGPDSAAIAADVSRRGLVDRVHLVGPTRNVSGTLRQVDVFVSGALAEPFGLSVAEARAAGCAVVATAVGGVPEVLDDGRAGALVPARDPSAMAAALRGLLQDPVALEDARARALDGAERFTVQRMAHDYDGLYTALLEGSPRGAARWRGGR